jgi:phosphoglycolate phosphatase-like HAD superfamily hydrolase
MFFVLLIFFNFQRTILMHIHTLSLAVILAISSTSAFATTCNSSDSTLPSWGESESRTAIETFVKDVTTLNSKNYVAPDDRIAVFDNDGTLWSEKPAYFQLVFTIEQIKKQAKNHPEWKTQTPFKWVLEDDMASLMAADHQALLDLVKVTHSGMTVETFQKQVKEWVSQQKDPRFNRSYEQLTYQPMKEMLTYLKDNEFKTYIVSGGGVDFMRAWAEDAYNIPPENVIGSSFGYDFTMIDGKATVTKNDTITSLNDKEVKVENIQRVIGKKPILAVGNSDGDQAMMQWSTNQNTPSMAMIVHYTDADREWQYDRDSSVGRLDKALDEAKQKDNWHLIDMKNDWCTVYGKAK